MRSWRSIVTLVLLFAVCLMLVHWHQDSPGQRCEICFAQNLPSIHVPFAAWLPALARVEWSSLVEEPASAHSVFSESKPSRAPPNALSL
jgi:hypothetical protein